MFGKGYMMAVSSAGIPPGTLTDFIFAVIGEELGCCRAWCSGPYGAVIAAPCTSRCRAGHLRALDGRRHRAQLLRLCVRQLGMVSGILPWSACRCDDQLWRHVDVTLLAGFGY